MRLQTCCALQKTTAINTAIFFFSTIYYDAMLNSCRKNANDVPANAGTSSIQSDLQYKEVDASVATDGISYNCVSAWKKIPYWHLAALWIYLVLACMNLYEI
jgi:hypothetical protein